MPQTAKDRWNFAHYKQMKFWTPLQVAAKFKSICEKQNISMASVIIQFMCEYSAMDINAQKNMHTNNPDTGTRKLRRKEMHKAIKKVTAIYEAEAGTLTRIPANFHGTDTYSLTKDIVEALETAIETLKSVYDD
jgi:S-adenosylmethionine hydrolase